MIRHGDMRFLEVWLQVRIYFFDVPYSDCPEKRARPEAQVRTYYFPSNCMKGFFHIYSKNQALLREIKGADY